MKRLNGWHHNMAKKVKQVKTFEHTFNKIVNINEQIEEEENVYVYQISNMQRMAI